MSQNSQLTFKIIVVGNCSVGKSCLLMRYVDNQYTPHHYPTIGLEFLNKSIRINQVNIKLQIWDTAGQETFKSIVRNFYKNSDAIFIVYSIVDKRSFQAIGQWFEQACDNSPVSAIFILIGTQKDLEYRREVSYEQGEQKMKQYKMAFFFQTSALQDINIDCAFEQTAKQLFINRLLRTKEQDKQVGVNLKYYDDFTSNSRCC